MKVTSLEVFLLHIDLLDSCTLIVDVPHAASLFLELIMLRPTLFEYISGSKQRKSSDFVIDEISLTVELDLLISAFHSPFSGISFIKFGRWNPNNAATDSVSLICDSFVYNLFEQGSEIVNRPIENNDTFDITVVLINFDLV